MGTSVSFQFRNEQFSARSRKTRGCAEAYRGTSHKQPRSLVSLWLIDADSAVQPFSRRSRGYYGEVGSQPVLWSPTRQSRYGDGARSRLVAKQATMAKSAIAEKGHLWMETR